MALAISELALVEPLPHEPFMTFVEDDGTITQAIYSYGPNQHTKRRWFPKTSFRDAHKKVMPYYRVEGDLDWQAGAGDEDWGLFAPVPIEGFENHWVLEVEGEKCARILAEHGFAAISQPGCKHSPELIADRYDALYGKVRGVIYLADNDLEGTRKAHRCRDAAASVELDFVHVDMAVVFEDLPLKDSIDDVPDVPAAVQKIVDSLPSQLPAQVDYDDEPEPVIPRDPEESTAQADLPQGEQRTDFTWERLLPDNKVRKALQWVSKPLTTDALANVLIFLTALSGTLKLGTNVRPTSGWVMPIALWLMVIAKTGRGKSPAFENLAELPLEPIADDFAKQYKSEKAHYDAIKPKAEKPTREPRQYFAHLQKYNPATMDRQLEWHEELKLPLLLLLDEIEGLWKTLDRDESGGSGDGITQLLSLFNGRGSNTIRMGGNRCFKRAHFAICGFIQPSKLRKRIGGEDDDGRHARFLQIGVPKGVMRCRRGPMDSASDTVEKEHRKVLSDLAWALHKLPPERYSLSIEDGAQDAFCDWAEAYWEKADQPTTKPLLAALYNKLPDHAAKLSGALHLVNEYDPENRDQWHPSKTIPLSVIQLALAIIDCLVVEAERFHANTDDLEAQAIRRFKELPPVEWTWSKFKGKCNDPIRDAGSKLWTNIVTAIRDAGIGEVTKSKPLTFRRRTNVDGHRKMSA